MGCYYTLCHNTYAYSLLFYKVCIKRENAGSWDSRLEKEQILETYSAQLQKSWNSRKLFLEYIKNTERRKHQRGPPTSHEGGRRALPPGRAPLPRGPPGDPPMPIFGYMESFVREKNNKQAYGTKIRRHEAEPWRNQSRAPAELFCRGNFPPGGGNHHHRHHQCSSHRERAISINILTTTISSPNPSSSLVSNSCLKVRDWC